MKIAPEYDGLVAYANDAMEGLDLANQLMDEERRAALRRTLEAEHASCSRARRSRRRPRHAPGRRASSVRQDVESRCRPI